MGVTGIDWQDYLHGARSQTSSMTLIYDGHFLDGNVYNEMAMFGLVSETAIVNA